MPPRIHASVTPSVGTAGEYGTWIVRCTVEDGQLRPGDSLAVALPNTWHAWLRNSAKGVHSIDPASPNYVSAKTSREDVEVRCIVPDGSTDEFEKATRDALAGPPNRCAYHTEITLTQGVLQAGDWIDVTYGDTSGGSPGFTAALHPNGPEPVHIAVNSADTGSENSLLPVEECPLLVATAAEPVDMAAYAPSQARVGSEAACHVVALDAWQNPATGAQMAFKVAVAAGHAEHPEFVALNPESGTCVVPFTPTAPGILRLEIAPLAGSNPPFDRLRANGKNRFRANGEDGLRAKEENRHKAKGEDDLGEGTLVALSNPVLCAAELPDEQVYWGDLHSHARRSFDATGDLPFHYARDVARLDFYALTDHVEGLSDEMWQEVRLATQDWYDPGRFATILGYEATFPAPWAHHNVYFRDDGDVRVGRHNGTVQDLWQQLAAGRGHDHPAPHRRALFTQGEQPARRHRPEYRLAVRQRHLPPRRRGLLRPRPLRVLRPGPSLGVPALRLLAERLGHWPPLRAGRLAHGTAYGDHLLVGQPSGAARQAADRPRGSVGARAHPQRHLSMASTTAGPTAPPARGFCSRYG